MSIFIFLIQEPGDEGKFWSKEDLPLVEEDEIREYLSKLVIHKSMGPDNAPTSTWEAGWL